MTSVKQIPDILTYEMDNGQPIYYSGYGDVINGTLAPEAIMGSSILQSLIIIELIKYLGGILLENYFLLGNELGVFFPKVIGVRPISRSSKNLASKKLMINVFLYRQTPQHPNTQTP